MEKCVRLGVCFGARTLQTFPGDIHLAVAGAGREEATPAARLSESCLWNACIQLPEPAPQPCSCALHCQINIGSLPHHLLTIDECHSLILGP